VSADQARVEFESRVDATLQTTCELARALIGAHQAAMSLIVADDWLHARKYFSPSGRYAAFHDFTMPARGVGVHALVVTEGAALRLTQTELENHPAWLGYAEAAESHQPLTPNRAVSRSAGRPAGWRRCRAGGPPRGAGRHAEAVAGEALRSDGQLVPSSAAAALMLPSCSAKAKDAFGFGPVGQEAAGLPAQRWRSCRAPLRFALSYERVPLEVDVQ
jgi:hypothetical protein